MRKTGHAPLPPALKLASEDLLQARHAGTLVQAALNERTVFALNPEVAEALSARVIQWETVVRGSIETMLGVQWGESISWYVVNWFQNIIRYIPDKTMSAAIALVIFATLTGVHLLPSALVARDIVRLAY